MFVKKGSGFLSGASLRKLEEIYTLETQTKAKLRLQCAVLRKKGNTQLFIAEVTGKPVQTVSDILRRFEQRGMQGCYAKKQAGKKPKLKPLQKIALKQALSRSPENQELPFVIWTTKLIQYFIEKKFGVTYAVRYVRDLVSSLNMSIQTPRPEHIKANKKLQARFKKKLDDKLGNLRKLDMRSSFWTKASSP